MTLENLQKQLTLLASVICVIILSSITYEKVCIFPIYISDGLYTTLVLLVSASALFYISLRNEYVLANIVSSMAMLITFYNTIIFKIFHITINKYVSEIVEQPSFYPFTESGAMMNYKIFMVLVLAVFALLWLRYTVIIKHNILER